MATKRFRRVFTQRIIDHGLQPVIICVAILMLHCPLRLLITTQFYNINRSSEGAFSEKINSLSLCQQPCEQLQPQSQNRSACNRASVAKGGEIHHHLGEMD